MKRLLLSSFSLLLAVLVYAQDVRAHKIVFDMASSDTASHSALLRQISNILERAPNSEVEVVFHGKSVYAMTRNNTTVEGRIAEMAKNKHITFAVCNNSMKRLQLTAADLLPSAVVVPMAMLELTDKQEQGWSYIVAGH